jgi:hypothetical protein
MKAACAKCSGVSATAPGQATPTLADPADKRKPLGALPPTFDATRLQQAILGFRTPVQQVSVSPQCKRKEHRLRVFENRVLRRIFGLKRDEETGEWRKLHNEELRDLYSTLSIIRIIKSRIMRWAGHVVQMGRRGTRIDYWWESQRERDH